MTTDQEKVNPGSQGGDDAVVDQIVRFYATTYSRVLAACAVISEERGAEHTVADMIADALSTAVEDVERRRAAGDADDAA